MHRQESLALHAICDHSCIDIRPYIAPDTKGITLSLLEILVKRLLLGLATLLFVSVLVFLGTEILPGDVANAILGQGATPELITQIRERLGLNEPLHVRYLVWLSNFVTGDFGSSLANGADIGTEINRRASNTIILAGCTALLAVPLSILLGLACAIKPGGLIDRIITSLSLALISLPDFLVAVVLVTIFAIKLRWLPAIASIRPSYEFFDWVRILILPVAGLTFTILAHMVRMTRSAVLNVLTSPAIEMAILKGVPRRRLLLRHALPNAFGPIINVVALNLAYLISGVVVIETLFNFPGLGRYMVEAVTNRDVPVVQTCAMIFCCVYVVLNMTADILSIMANPRVRYQK